MASSEAHPSEQPKLVAVAKPLSLVPVGLKEAAIDSPSFRATAVHFCDQVEATERWLDGLAKAATKLSQEATNFEPLCTSFIQQCHPPNHFSEAILDHDYTLLALRRLADGISGLWLQTIIVMKNAQRLIADPIKNFLQNDLWPFKDARRNLEEARKNLDSALSRYSSQAKTKEPSSIREEAFQLHESRKAYLKASMDLGVLAPQLRFALDNLLARVSSDEWHDIVNLCRTSTSGLGKHSNEMTRIRNWSSDMAQGEKALRRELLSARKQIEESVEKATRPSRDLDDYSVSTVPNLGSGPAAMRRIPGGLPPASSKQGWLNLRTLTGKPTRISWVRRWFFVKNGIFGWLMQGSKSGGVEESEKIGVLLCGIRPPAHEERRFCFEVKTKDTSIILQAETQNDLSEWVSVFEAAKQKAVEEPGSTEFIASGGSSSADAAFAVSPASAPELAARRPDGQPANINAEEAHAGFLSVEGDTAGPLPSRTSFDVNALRRQAAREEGESSRDHASRILQKLDIHRKSTASPQMSSTGFSSSPPVTGTGIGSLIAASHTAMPFSPTHAQKPSLSKSDAKDSPQDATFLSTMAPTTLVNPPAQTNLTKTALKVGVDRGLDLGAVDVQGGMPSGLMANQWGSTNYGHVSRVERGEVGRSNDDSKILLHPPTSQSQSRRSSDPPTPLEGATLDGRSQSSARQSPVPSPRPPQSPPARHRKTIGAADGPAQPSPGVEGSTGFPQYYPPALRAHDTQFRMLFPNVATSERVVLVFRASWNATGNQELPGRVYATPSSLYFYSNHLGMVLVTGVSLETISKVTLESSSSHDYFYIHVTGRDAREEGRTTLKTILEAPKLLQRRLNFLVANCNNEDDVPLGLEPVLRTLVGLERQHPVEEEPTFDDLEEPDTSLHMNGSQRPSDDGMPKLIVDRNIYTGDGVAVNNDGADVIRFKLPSQPVQYTPINVTHLATEKVLDVSAKALLHIIFGDKSALCSSIYQERQASSIMQWPWVKLDDEGHFERQFEMEIPTKNVLRQSKTIKARDTQRINIANDHLCYMITDSKYPWHLPSADSFRLTSKMVITHVAKSKCKFAIFIKVDWLKTPWLSQSMIERRALDDLHLDALNMIDVVAEQVKRLGPNCHTRKAMDIFGYIGQLPPDSAQIVSASTNLLTDGQFRSSIRTHSIAGLVWESAQSKALNALSAILMSTFGLLKALFKAASLHALILAGLLASLSLNAWSTSTVASSWWRDRSAASYMARLGVTPNPTMSKAVYLKDLPRIYNPPLSTHNVIALSGSSSSSQCASTFQQLLSSTDLDASASLSSPAILASTSSSPFSQHATTHTSRRLQRTRRRLGTYRHDILVALRLVNRIEEESVRAEYENWLIDENEKCASVGEILRREGRDVGQRKGGKEGGAASDESGMFQGLDSKEKKQLARWHDEYCGSCKKESEAVGLSKV
ncbi:MAG: SNF1-interacting protein [Alyxoria varia]|nr:MAG: SNF1-interacting protein [Alyxoria varia]